MSIHKAITATTHVDSQREKLAKSALEGMVSQSKKKYIRVLNEHDPRKAPIGRVIDARLVKLEDGSYGIESVFELFDGKDPVPDEEDKWLEIAPDESHEDIFIKYDYSYSKKEHIEKIESFNNGLKKHRPLEYSVKKSAEPLSILTIGGFFILGKILEGFLEKVGEEAFLLLKKQLIGLVDLQKDKERVLHFDLTVKKDEKTYSVNLYLTNPTEKDIEIVLTEGLKKLDEEIGGYLARDVKEIGINYTEEKFDVTYMINGKAKAFRPLEERRFIDILA